MTSHRGAVSPGAQTGQTRPAETTAYINNKTDTSNLFTSANETTSTTGETHLSRTNEKKGGHLIRTKHVRKREGRVAM